MQTLPNGVTVFNATPHDITFWREGWADVVVVAPDTVINATPTEQPVSCVQVGNADWENVWFVKTVFLPNDVGFATIARAYEMGADVVIGSIIAAQAYPGKVAAMIPCVGFERVPPAEKRVRPDKFTVF